MANNVLLSVHPETLTIVTTGSATDDADGDGTTTLQLNNVGFKAVMFRIKTTAPKRYAVKPTKGVILSNATEVIQIHLTERVEINARDEFRLEFAAVEDSDDCGVRNEHVAELLAAKSSRSGGKYKRDIQCNIKIQVAPTSTSVISKRQPQPRHPLSPHTTTSSSAKEPSSPQQTTLGAQPLDDDPQFGGEIAQAPSSIDRGQQLPHEATPVKPAEPLQRSPVPVARASAAMSSRLNAVDAAAVTTPPTAKRIEPGAATSNGSSSMVFYMFIALVALAVAVLWTQKT